MIRKIALAGVITAFSFASLVSDIEKDLIQAIIPKTKIEKIKHTQIDGLYEVFLANGNVFYVYPYKRLIVFGEIYTNTGINLTNKDRQKWKEEVNKKRLKGLGAKKLIEDSFKINYNKGSKRYALVMFTDPECPFCRKVDKFLKFKNASVYVNYMPLSFHPHAKKWALQILSSKNKKKAIEAIEKHNKDLNVTITDEAKKTLLATQKLAKELQINGTPTIFVIDTKTNKVIDRIDGANIPKINSWLKKDENEK